ncbi:MAG TPA: hypothetical protein VJT72_17270 [Pseudonocardiaceae bacterium]|nr:hypothetical protein [Pseudonocardiaceae bacterium]
MDKHLFVGIGVILLMAGLVLLVKSRAVSDTEFQGSKIPAGVVLLILGLAAAAYPFSSFFKPSAPDPVNGSSASRTPAASTMPAPTTTATPVPITITSPANGAGVEVPFVVSGTAPDLGGDRLWLFTWSENETVRGKVYYPTPDAPIDVAGGHWDARVGGLGDPGTEIGHNFTLILVRADSRCSREIENIVQNSAEGSFVQQLPSGCTETAPPLRIKKEA